MLLTVVHPEDAGMETTQAIAHPRTIHRALHGRMLAGVAAGVADYFAIDPVIVRTIFVALTFAGGSGLALYIAGWLLIPEEGHTRPLLQTGFATPGGKATRIGIVLTLGLVALAIGVAGAASFWPGWSGGIGSTVTALAILSLVFVVLAVRSRGVPFVLMRLALGLIAFGLIVATIALASVSAIARATGVPLRGGIGDRTWQPASANELPSAYRLGVGAMTVDLSHLSFTEGERHVVASVGVGRLVVIVPDGEEVTVSARAGAGETTVFGSRDDGLGARRLSAPSSSGTHLVIDARAGVGEVEVVRARARRSAA